MKNIFLILTITGCINIFPQQPEQITNFDFDSRNPAFIPMEENNQELFFEGWTDTISNIYFFKYDSDLDTFRNLTALTNNGFVNRNVNAQFHYTWSGKQIKRILFETNENGNWDIASSVDSGSGWTQPEIIINSEEDELDPEFGFPYEYQLAFLLFSRGNSVYSLNIDSQGAERKLFEGNDSMRYSNPEFTAYSDSHYIFTERRINGGDPYIVCRKKYYLDTLWSEIIELDISLPAVNPEVVHNEITTSLNLEIFSDNRKKSVLIDMEEILWGTELTLHELIDDTSLETSNFSPVVYPLPVWKQTEDYNSFFPYSFKYLRNDSAFIRSGLGWYDESDKPYRDSYTKLKTAGSETGIVGYNNGLISYTVWEDSADGRINLFGLKRVDPWGAVDDENIINDFVLQQNYPNPFNPVTKIKFITRKRSFIKLSVYDLLGREASLLINEEKPGGEYEVLFNAAGLPSGIYFYKLQTENFSSVKKMVLLK